jgi:hypothetical protein
MDIGVGAIPLGLLTSCCSLHAPPGLARSRLLELPVGSVSHTRTHSSAPSHPEKSPRTCIGTGTFLFAVGVLASVSSDGGLNVHSIDLILMIVGAVTAVLSTFFPQSRGGFHRGAGEGTVVRGCGVL